LVSGNDGAVRWNLYAWAETSEEGRRICQRAAARGTTGSSASSGSCTYVLPIDLTELFAAPDIRLIAGPVTTSAAVVLVRARDGREWRLPPLGSSAQLGRAFFISAIDRHVILRDVTALGDDGRVLGRKAADAAGEAMLIERHFS
jgi:hypothetical protein